MEDAKKCIENKINLVPECFDDVGKNGFPTSSFHGGTH
jgi:hypothetical protein